MEQTLNIGLRLFNSLVKILSVMYLMPMSEYYGTLLAIIFGVFIFSNRFLYGSIGLYGRTKRDLYRLIILKSKVLRRVLVVNLSALFIFMLPQIYISQNVFEWIAFIMLGISISTMTSYLNELVRFSAKSIIRRSVIYISDLKRVFLEILTVIFVIAAWYSDLELSNILKLTYLCNIILCVYFIYMEEKIKYYNRLKSRSQIRWTAFLLLSGALFGLDRAVVKIFYDDPSVYISILTVTGPIAGMLSYIFIWLTRDRLSGVLRYILMIICYLLIGIFITILNYYILFDPELKKINYWREFFGENIIYISIFGLMVLTRDYLMQEVFDRFKDHALLTVILPVILFIILIALEVDQSLLLISTMSSYVATGLIAKRVLNGRSNIKF